MWHLRRFAAVKSYILSVAHQRESGILTGAGSWFSELGILLRATALGIRYFTGAAALGIRYLKLSAPEPTLVSTQFLKRVELHFQFSSWKHVPAGTAQAYLVFVSIFRRNNFAQIAVIFKKCLIIASSNIIRKDSFQP